MICFGPDRGLIHMWLNGRVVKIDGAIRECLIKRMCVCFWVEEDVDIRGVVVHAK